MQEVIEKRSGPCIVLAGAGTGKTYTIVEKIKYLIKKEIYSPDRIVCLTFSNEAVASLQKRIASALPDLQPEKMPIIRTFHSFCADILRQHGTKVGIKENFKLLLPDDAKILLHKSFKLHPRLCMKYIDVISVAKDLGISPNELEQHINKTLAQKKIDNLERALESTQFTFNTLHLNKNNRSARTQMKDELAMLGTLHARKKFLLAWRAYEKIKEKRSMLDYADLHLYALALLQNYPQVSEQFNYVIVDEFQDTNKIQCDLLQALAPHRNITIVGDLNQSIYRFRGAYRDNVAQFKTAFNVEKEDIVALDKSRRSPNTVLRTAQKLISHNYANKDEVINVLNSDQREGTPVEVIELLNDKEEVRRIVDTIRINQEKGLPLEEICVMFRTHGQSRRLKKQLDESHIPYVSVTRTSLLTLSPIRKILNYATIVNKLANKESGGEQAWWEALYNEHVEPEDFAQISRLIKNNITEKCLTENLIQKLPALELQQETKDKVQLMLKTINSLKDAAKKPAHEALEIIRKALFSEESKEDQINLEKFISTAKEYAEFDYADLGHFLYHLDIIQKLGIEIEAPNTQEAGVRIMTNHATKGLEYRIVIVAGMVQGKFPAERVNKDNLIPSELLPEIKSKIADVPDYAKEEVIAELERENQLNEERRLCYVAFTRAKEKLILTYAKDYSNRPHLPSQFLQEINYQSNPDITFESDNTQTEHNESAPTITTALNMKSVRPRRIAFSPSSLLLFTECQKKYEYKYRYQMPEKQPISWEDIRLGSFVHEIIEEGIQRQFKGEKDFTDLARSRYSEEQWKVINLDDALTILRVFFQRNKHKYNSQSLTEQKLQVAIDGLNFEGYADRIDIHPEGIEIIDYKTGKSFLTAQHRNWQLGLYALAAPNLNIGPVKRLTLDMLRHEKPLEFDLSPEGIAKEINSPKTSFNLHLVKQELIQTAQKILECYNTEFAPCPIEKNCEFCNEFIWKS